MFVAGVLVGFIAFPTLVLLMWLRPWRWFICLLLVGCSHLTIGQLEDAANECGTGPECRPLWDRVYKREAREAEKERLRQPCPPGMVKYADSYGQRCITRAELDRILRGLR